MPTTFFNPTFQLGAITRRLQSMAPLPYTNVKMSGNAWSRSQMVMEIANTNR